MLAHAWAVLGDVHVRGLERPRGRLALRSGALAGSSLGLSPNAVASELGFNSAVHNSIDGTASRDVSPSFAWVCAMAAVDVAHEQEEVTTWAAKEFSFVTLDDAFSTGSSIMPQKRTRTSRSSRAARRAAVGDLTGLLATLKGLPLAYNRDLQEQEPVFDAIDQLELLPAVAGMMATLEFPLRSSRGAHTAGLRARHGRGGVARAPGCTLREAHEMSGEAVRGVRGAGASSCGTSRTVRGHLDAPHAGRARGAHGGRCGFASRSSQGGTTPEAVARQLTELNRQLAGACRVRDARARHLVSPALHELLCRPAPTSLPASSGRARLRAGHRPQVALRLTGGGGLRRSAGLGPPGPGAHASTVAPPATPPCSGRPATYVYFTYGLHHAVNVVCRPRAVAS
ncbi:DNA-3-methyladenine glycosylase [Kocuria rhizophila]|nr:DNA-3-methyladenine glycosylase [Kocuria rhizophila]